MPDWYIDLAIRLTRPYEAARRARMRRRRAKATQRILEAQNRPCCTTRERVKLDLWNTPTTSSGVFEEAKRSGDVFRGARKADR